MLNRKHYFMASLVLLAVLLSGCAQTGSSGGNGNTGGAGAAPNKTVVAAGDTVSVDYKGTLEDGTVFDKSEGRGPLEFVAGIGKMIKGFDDAVLGMAEGEEKTVTLPPEKAYGMPDERRVAEWPKSNFPEPDKLVVGQPVPATTSDGTPVEGIIKEIKDDTVLVDFNHPLAGKTLTFWIKVVKIQKK